MAVLGCWAFLSLFNIIFQLHVVTYIYLKLQDNLFFLFFKMQAPGSEEVSVSGTQCQRAGTAHRDLCCVRKYFIRLVFHEDTLAS